MSTGSVNEVLSSARYSTVTVNKNLNNSNSTVEPTTVLHNLSDIIPDDGYYPFYLKRLNELGYQRFMELANKARAGSETPAKLFCWMLKHNKIVQ